MKILHTDNDENPAVELDAAAFLAETAAAADAAKNARPIDISTGQPETSVQIKKKNNNAIWAIIILVILLIIAGLVFYFQLKAKKENEHIGN